MAQTERERRLRILLVAANQPGAARIQAAAMIRDPDSGVRNPAIPVIAMTAEAASQDRDRCLAAGMDGYIAKPIHPDELFQMVEKTMGIKWKK